jgi:hypothetical protein
MKKVLFSSAFILCLAVVAKAQYIVTKVNGRVKKADGTYVTPGAQLKDNDQLTWSSQKDNLYVVIIGKGEKIISPAPATSAGSGAITQQLMSSLRQSSKSASLSGRGEIIEKLPEAMHTNPNSNGKVIIEQENKFLFDPKLYPQTGGAVFFAEIDMPGQNPIIRRLKTNGDTLLIDYTDLITETTGPLLKYSLGYHNPGAANASQLVSAFVPYFDMTGEMDDFIPNTILAYKGGTATKEAVRDSVYQNLYASSAKPNGILFTALFNKYWVNPSQTTPPQTFPTGSLFSADKKATVPQLSNSVGVTRDELPSNFSLRQYAPPVGQQGNYQSCVAWSTAYAARTITFAVRNNYSRNNHYDLLQKDAFAPDFVYNNIRLSADCNKPTYMVDALKFMTQKGNLIKGPTFDCGISYNPNMLAAAQDYRIKDYISLNITPANSKVMIQKMKALLASKHPLPFSMYFSAGMYRVPQSGIWYPSEADRQNLIGTQHGTVPYVGHAMCVIGYNDDTNGGSFEIMNSWGLGVGNLGYYWINYDDFCAFQSEVYAINDFEPVPAPQVVVAQVVKQAAPVPSTPAPQIARPEPVVPVTIKSVVTPDRPAAPVVVVPKPALKGAMEFMLMQPSGQFESIPVTKSAVDSRGQFVEADTNPTSYPNFVLSKPFYSGSHYKIKFDLAQPAYVYVLGMDKESNYNLFPQKKLNESAWINIKNATLYLPNDSTHYTLDNTVGKEKMCVLVSKSPIDINALNQKFAAGDHNLYEAIRKFLPTRLMEVKTNMYMTNKISFDSLVDDDNVLAFFIEIDHKDKP